MTQGDLNLDEAMTRVKKVVYKNRIRLKEFISDFDKLRSGYVHSNQFLSGLSMAGLDKHLTPSELQTICAAYTLPRTSSLDMVNYQTFVADVETVFTLPELEKRPLVPVAAEPSGLTDKTRYQKSSRDLGFQLEAQVAEVTRAIAETCYKRGLLVKPFFDDAALDDHSVKLVGHVTVPQFKQCINVKLGLNVKDSDLDLLAAKYRHEDYKELVNYVAFSNVTSPSDGTFDPYTFQ